MKRLLPIAASLALILAASAFAQDAAAPAPTPDTAPATPVAAEVAAAPQAAPAAAAIAGDAARGKGLTYTCRGCHGVTGYKNAYPSYHVPKLGGQSETYL
ncbi:MAG TPA: cytochrome c, partial [Thermomonas sp.]|nr:cytochrome c [Thermomonas sp.]